MTSAAGMLRSSVWIWAAYGITALSGLLLSPFVVGKLGATGYGVWVLIGSMVGYLGLLDLGVRGAIARFVAAHFSVDDHAGASAKVAGALRLFGALGSLAFLFSLLLAGVVDSLFDIPPGLSGVAQTIIVLGGASVAASFFGGVFGGVLAGLQRFDLDSALEIGLTLLRVVLVVAALSAGLGLVSLAVIQLGIVLLRGSISYRLCRSLYPALRLRSEGSPGAAIRSLLAFSLVSSVMHVSGQVIYYTDALVIGALLPLPMITFYAIAANLADYARQIAAAVARIVTPKVSSEQARHGLTAAREVAMNSARWVGFVTIPIAMTFVLRGERFIGLWMGSDFSALSGQVLTVLAVTVWISGGHFVSVSALMGTNQHRGLAGGFALQAAANLALSLTLVGPLGLVGVAIGTVVPALVLNLGFIPWYLHRMMGLAPMDFISNAWLRPTIVAAPFALATAVAERLWVPGSLVSFLVQTAALLPILGVTVFYGGLRSPERERLRAVAGFSGREARQPSS